MRLKYFMRGLGSGIVLTAAVVALTTKPQISDAEIIERATELGMVSKDETGLDEGDLTGLSKEDAANNKDTDNEKSDKNENNKIDQNLNNENTKDESTKDETSKDEISTDKTSGTTDQKSVATKAEESENTNQNLKVTINGGMHSYAVSRILEDAGVIDDAKKFDQYLVKYDFQTRIIPGTYEIKEGSSYDQIAQIITK